MRIVIAPDSFKECLSAPEAAEAIAAGWRRAHPDAAVDLVPMADGGEGTTKALVSATGGHYIEQRVRDPLGHLIPACYGILGDGRTAVIEVAAASGLALVPPKDRAPGFTTSFGTGQLIRHALEQGVATIIVGLGGSATNDAGAGMAQALGYGLRDIDDRELPFGGLALARLHWIEEMKKHQALGQVDIIGACDVENPLCGPDGASLVYAPQKGASQKTAELLDAALRHFGEYIEDELRVKVMDVSGAGAAGGLGAGLLAFCDAELRPGFEVVAEACRLAERLETADLVITGEGRLDAQTLSGKVPLGVARLARFTETTCWAVAGDIDASAQADLHDAGIEQMLSLVSLAGDSAESMRHPQRYLAGAAERLARSFAA